MPTGHDAFVSKLRIVDNPGLKSPETREGANGPSHAPAIDVFIPTHNSAHYLAECLDSVRKAYPIRRIVIVDGSSTDGTMEIARAHGCTLVTEAKGLGYARSLMFKMAETDIFAMVDSNIVYHEFGWFEKAVSLLRGKTAAVMTAFDETGVVAKYEGFWKKHRIRRPRPSKPGFASYSVLLRRDVTRGISIPDDLLVGEDTYFLGVMERSGYDYDCIRVNGVHYEYGVLSKVRGMGANCRTYYKYDHSVMSQITGNLALPLKGIIASCFTFDPAIFVWSLRFACNFFIGFILSNRYAVLKKPATVESGRPGFS